MDLDKHIHRVGCFIGKFTFEPDPDTIPIVFICREPWCNSTLWFEGVRIVRYGFVTCVDCFRPMHELQNHTVH